jgi:glucan phosphoethanolaminetransferase (alkaline phosphatase superfamily)
VLSTCGGKVLQTTAVEKKNLKKNAVLWLIVVIVLQKTLMICVISIKKSKWILLFFFCGEQAWSSILN